MSLFSALRYRWDLDPEAEASLPFARAIAIVNLRRIEVVCLLAFATNLIAIARGLDLLSMMLPMPAMLGAAWLSRRIEHWPSLRAQQAAVILFVALALAEVVWAVSQVSQSGRLSGGFLLNLLSITMLFVLRPRTLAPIIVGSFLVYCPVVMALPVPDDDKVTGIVNAAIVAGIAQVAGWLIYSARRSDHEQKRIVQAQNARLTAQSIEREQLMAITAHDLRSPLYGLRNLLDLAARRAALDGTPQIGPMRDAIFGVDNMLSLVRRLLEAHSAEHAPLTTWVRADIRDHLVAAARRVAPAAEAAGCSVGLQLPDAPVLVAFDGHALSRILDNLLSNAVRFSPRGVAVRMGCASRDGAALIEIEDRGPGFDAAGRAAMFSKFHQRDASTDRAKSGTGMGLFIAASFAARMGAQLSFRPGDPTGACFALLVSSQGGDPPRARA